MYSLMHVFPNIYPPIRSFIEIMVDKGVLSCYKHTNQVGSFIRRRLWNAVCGEQKYDDVLVHSLWDAYVLSHTHLSSPTIHSAGRADGLSRYFYFEGDNVISFFLRLIRHNFRFGRM